MPAARPEPAKKLVDIRSIPDAPLFIAINSGSGADIDREAMILEKLRAQGRAVTLHKIPANAVKQTCATLVQQAVQAGGIVVAAGGDGTVNAIAAACYEYGAPMGVIPLGTFNYFARAVGIPVELDAALDVLATGKIEAISAGFVQEHLFINNASFGLYPELIRKREQHSSRYGRKRIVAALSALHSIFSRQKLFSIRFNSDEANGSHRTSMVFVGNNSLQLDNFGLEVSECTLNDRLAVVILRRMDRLQMCRLIWRGIVKNFKFESKLVQFCADRFEVETDRKKVEMVVDGEIVHCTAPLTFRVVPRAINVVVPTIREKNI